jgi:hypothetical protein
MSFGMTTATLTLVHIVLSPVGIVFFIVLATIAAKRFASEPLPRA